MADSHYTPGVCNINDAEARYRKKAFYLGLAIGLPLFVVLVVLRAHPLIGLVLFIPSWIGAIGYLQAKHKFCVGYAASGVHNTSDKYGETEAIIDEAQKKLDKKRARSVNIQSMLIAAIVTTTAYVVLLLI